MEFRELLEMLVHNWIIFVTNKRKCYSTENFSLFGTKQDPKASRHWSPRFTAYKPGSMHKSSMHRTRLAQVIWTTKWRQSSILGPSPTQPTTPTLSSLAPPPLSSLAMSHPTLATGNPYRRRSSSNNSSRPSASIASRCHPPRPSAAPWHIEPYSTVPVLAASRCRRTADRRTSLDPRWRSIIACYCGKVAYQWWTQLRNIGYT